MRRLFVSLGLALALSRAAASSAALTEILVDPKSADPGASKALEPHYVVIDRDLPRKGLLFVHLPGTDLLPTSTKLIVKAAAASGFHALGLTYPNDSSLTELCSTSTDRGCFEKVHDEVIYGVDASPLVEMGRADSIEERLVRLLRYLDAQHPADGWGAYLDASGKPLWARISLSGFSQGSGHAAYIAKTDAVFRLSTFAGPNERFVADNTLPPWTAGPRATPASASRGFCHEQDTGAGKVGIWTALGWDAFGGPVWVESGTPPWGGTHMLLTKVPPDGGNDYHKSVIQDLVTPKGANGVPLFLPVWRLMAGFDEPASPTSTWILPSSARAAGSGGSFYTTGLVVSNPGTTAAWVALKFLGNSADGRDGAEKTFSLGPGATVAYPDVLGSVFGLSNGFGAIRVTSNAAGLVLAAQTATPGFGGTFGQSVPAVASSELASVSVSRSISGIQEDGAFRTNVFLANATEQPVAVDGLLLSPSGEVLATKRWELPPLGMVQSTRVVREMGVAASVPLARLVLSTGTAGGAFAAYASVIDERTNDPRTLLAR